MSAENSHHNPSQAERESGHDDGTETPCDRFEFAFEHGGYRYCTCGLKADEHRPEPFWRGWEARWPDED